MIIGLIVIASDENGKNLVHFSVIIHLIVKFFVRIPNLWYVFFLLCSLHLQHSKFYSIFFSFFYKMNKTHFQVHITLWPFMAFLISFKVFLRNMIETHEINNMPHNWFVAHPISRIRTNSDSTLNSLALTPDEKVIHYGRLHRKLPVTVCLCNSTNYF